MISRPVQSENPRVPNGDFCTFLADRASTVSNGSIYPRPIQSEKARVPRSPVRFLYVML
jgi:hypothetical protein